MKLQVFGSVCLMAFAAGAALAQVNADIAIGAGTASVGSSNQSIDTFGTGSTFSTPSLHGGFGKVSGDLMLKSWLGVGAEYSFRFSKSPYAGLDYRPSFYDVNAVISPSLHNKRIRPEFQAGIGGMNLSFYETQSGCDAFGGCSSSSSLVESSHHLQFHGLAALRFYATPHVWVRPEVEIHYARNLFQFGSNAVPQYGVSVGYTFGGE